MRFFGSSKEKSHLNSKKTVLFVCVENAGRSQMAEGFFRRYAPEDYGPVSAGTSPTSIVNPLSVEEQQQKPKIITEEMIRQSSVRVNMGCMDKTSCPTLFLHNVIDWDIEDPKGKPVEKVREIREIIEARVREIVSSLIPDSQQVNI